MKAKRDTYRYHIKRGNEILHRGITNDLDRRHGEHKQNYGSDVRIIQVGPRISRDSALQWERNGGKKL